jgi:hypothetical protein
LFNYLFVSCCKKKRFEFFVEIKKAFNSRLASQYGNTPHFSKYFYEFFFYGFSLPNGTRVSQSNPTLSLPHTFTLSNAIHHLYVFSFYPFKIDVALKITIGSKFNSGLS